MQKEGCSQVYRRKDVLKITDGRLFSNLQKEEAQKECRPVCKSKSVQTVGRRKYKRKFTEGRLFSNLQLTETKKIILWFNVASGSGPVQRYASFGCRVFHFTKMSCIFEVSITYLFLLLIAFYK